MEEVKEVKKEKVKGEKDWRPIWLFLLISVVLTMVISFGAGVISGLKDLPLEETVTKGTAIASIAANVVLLIVFLIIYRKKLLEGIKKINKKTIILIIVSAILVISINDIISNLFSILHVSMDNQETVTKYMEMFEVPMLIMTVICAPVVEELVFRYSLGTVCKKDITFVIVSGLLFGFAHGVGIASILYIYIGVSLAIIYLRSGKKIMAPIAVHFLNNLVSVLMMLLLK